MHVLMARIEGDAGQEVMIYLDEQRVCTESLGANDVVIQPAFWHQLARTQNEACIMESVLVPEEELRVVGDLESWVHAYLICRRDELVSLKLSAGRARRHCRPDEWIETYSGASLNLPDQWFPCARPDWLDGDFDMLIATDVGVYRVNADDFEAQVGNGRGPFRAWLAKRRVAQERLKEQYDDTV